MKCFNCSAELSEGTQICPKCGADQGFSKELIFKARNNDQAALTELYNKTYSSVYYTITALIKDEDAALDIMQDSYIKAFKNLDQIKEPEKFKAWVKQIAHNRSIDYLRKNKPLLFTEMESDESDVQLEFEDTDTENLPEAVVDRKETARLIREILNDLPDEQRAVISMFYYEQMSVKEIADQLGVSENTVKSRLNYGRKKVEIKVLELEKKGTKLYGLAPIPFFVFLLRSMVSNPAPIRSTKVKHIRASVTNELANAAQATGSGAEGASAKAGFFASLKSSLFVKIAAGVLATFVVVGGITALVGLGEAEEGTFGGGGMGGAGTGGQGSDSVLSAASTTQTETLTLPPTEAPTIPPTEAPTEIPTERTPDTLYHYSGTYTDPRGIITVELPEIWGDFGKIEASSGFDDLSQQYIYTVDFRFNNDYDGKEADGSCLELVVYDDPTYEPIYPTSMQTVVTRSENYTIVKQAHNGIGLYISDGEKLYPYGTQEFITASADKSQLVATVDSVLASLEIHDPPLYG